MNLFSPTNKFRALLPKQIEFRRAATLRVLAAYAPVPTRAALDKPGLLIFMRFTSALAGADPIAQSTDFVRGLLAEWSRFGQWVGRSIDALVERQRSIKIDIVPLRVLRAWHDHVAGAVDRVVDRRAIPVQRPRDMVAEMPEEREWELATRAFHSLSERAEHAVRLQKTAEIEINAAIYALDGLFDDLSEIMSISARQNVFAHQADYTEEHADTLYAAAVRAAVREIPKPQLAAARRAAA
jgi:hypothetical protein